MGWDIMTLGPKHAERTGKIIEAATHLFAHQGYHGTTTREIADLAGMREGVLFRHFGSKEDIFWAALRAGLSALPFRKDLSDCIANCDVPEVVLPKLFSTLVGTMTFRPQVLGLIAVAIIELRWKAESVCHLHLSPIFAEFNHYLSMNIKRGRIRNLDPVMITAALGMTILAHPLLSRLLTGGPPPHSDNREAVRAYANFWLEVLAPVPANDLRSSNEVSIFVPVESELPAD
jgi:AcrR family transcriptional regulator